jgi:hypothetical protein
MKKVIYNLFQVCSYLNKKSAVAIFAVVMLFSAPIIQAQDLYDMEVSLKRVEWGGANWCGDGVGENFPPLPPICVDLGNGVDIRFKYRVGADGVFPAGNPIITALEEAILGYSGYLHVGAPNSPQKAIFMDSESDTDASTDLDDQSDTDGQLVISTKHTTALKAVCAQGNITFDLDGWEEDAGFEFIPCPITANIVYDDGYDLICAINPLDNGDDARSKAVVNIPVPGLGSNTVSTDFGNYSMDWLVEATLAEIPTLTSADNAVCSGTSATFVANPSTIGEREYAWYTNANNPSGSIEYIGDVFTTDAITSFPATYYVAQYKNGCFGTPRTIVVNESFTNCGNCVAPDNLYAYNIDWTSASLGWNAVPGAIQYQMEGNPKGLRLLKCTKNTTTNGVQATGLFPFLKYEFRVRTQCPGTGWSAWSPYQEFTLNPLSTSTGRIAGDVLNPDELETVKFDVSSIFVASRDAAARTITVGYFGGDELGEGLIVISDVAGRQIFRGDFEITPANIKHIQTGDIADGIYFVSLYKDGMVLETEKVLVY